MDCDPAAVISSVASSYTGKVDLRKMVAVAG